jgi:hypothetical protein
MGYDRHRAIALKAADAQVLLNSALPFVFRTMTSAQVQMVQKVLDAEVVNPEIYKQANEIYRKSVIAQSGDIVMRNQQMVDRAYRLNATRIPAGEEDKHIRLDFQKLLKADALFPTTDNPDEATYLLRVRNTLSSKGVWLRFDHKLVRDPEDFGRWIVDPRSFQAWLSLGYGGDNIPTKDGQLTREALLGTTVLGAGYWENVHQGPVQQALEKEIHRLEQQIEYGVMQHDMLAKIRRDAFPGVTEVSDVLGGADFPSRSMWDHPHRLLVKALEMRVGGNVSGCQAYLVIAAIVTRNAARLLAAYIDDSSSGAERAVTVLKVAKTAGQVAEVGLAVTGVTGLVRGTVSVAAGGAAADASVDAAAERLVTRYVAKNPEIAADLDKVRWVPGPKGSVAGGVKPGTSSGAGTGWHKW